MKSYFEVGVRYDKTMDHGVIRKVTENYLLDAISFAEAEKRATEEVGAYTIGEFRVVTEKITNITEVLTTNDTTADKFYKVKHNFITFDEKSGKEKKQAQCIIIQASDVDDARERYRELVKDWDSDVILEAVSETKLVDYFPYKSE
ncbi:MAG: DUF4494 domain-containing protein [Bacteroidaceae bacterium]|nr:DUF4494 domain-containing protein [Bacteroidaceae bacterium]